MNETTFASSGDLFQLSYESGVFDLERVGKLRLLRPRESSMRWIAYNYGTGFVIFLFYFHLLDYH